MIGRRMMAAGVVVTAVAVGGVAGAVIGVPGLSGASSPSSSATTSNSTAAPSTGRHFRGFAGVAVGADRGVLDAAAKALNLSTQDLMQKLGDGKTTIADVAKDQKVDVKDVIAAMQKVADSDISNLVNNPFPVPPAFKGGPGPLPGAALPNGPGFGIGFGLRGIGGSIDSAAKALGISSQDLLKDLANGQSIADIAKSKKVDVGGIISTLVTDAKSRIAAAVKAGHLSQDQANKLETNLQGMISNVVNNAGPKGFGHFGGFGRRGGFGPGGFGPKGPATGGSGAVSAPAPGIDPAIL